MDLLHLSRKASCSFDKEKKHLIRSPCTYYHYLCDKIDDKGWGCGYRSLQSLCSWAVNQRLNRREEERSSEDAKGAGAVDTTKHGSLSLSRRSEEDSGRGSVPGSVVVRVPGVREIQRALVECGDKPQEFVGSREWIGCFEACLVLDHLYSVPCKIVHVSRGAEVAEHVTMLAQHFDSIGSPVMIGGDVDGASKTLIGVLVDQSQLSHTKFLIADPHYLEDSNETSVGGTHRDTASREDTALSSERGVQWHCLELFQDQSFYNFCLPQPTT